MMAIGACPAQEDHSGPEKAMVYVYRERAFVGNLRKMPIFMDEIQIGDLVNGRYFKAELNPGKHVFRCRTKIEAIPVELIAGQDYYLRAELIQGALKNHWRIIQVMRDQGKSDIARLKPLDEKYVSPVAR